MTGEKRRRSLPAWLWVGCVITALTLAATLLGSDDLDDPIPTPPIHLTAAWSDGGGSVANESVARGAVTVEGAVQPGTDLEVRLVNARFAKVPPQCGASTAKNRESWITDDGATLFCRLEGIAAGEPDTIEFDALADGPRGAAMTAVARLEGVRTERLPERLVTIGTRPETRLMRFLSSPDFLNADVADLNVPGTNFDPATDTNGTNTSYRVALDGVLSDWAARKPDDVLVAGDLVDGHWGVDPTGQQIFGPVDTFAERRRAVQRAADVYYPQWQQRFDAHGLTVHPAMGDHEYGDNDWPNEKLELADAYRRAFARHFTTTPTGFPVYRDRPIGSIHELTAYAYRPNPAVQVITIDPFTPTPKGMRLRVDQAQLNWLRDVLARAKRDGVQWTIVQGHLPILGPVRTGASSGLSYEGGTSSPLWKVFRQGGVDLYLSGEVHDVTALQQDGIVQLSHGGIFQFGRLTYLEADVYQTHLALRLLDYTFESSRDTELWSTLDPMPGTVTYRDPVEIGGAELWRDGRLARVGGAFAPYDGAP